MRSSGKTIIRRYLEEVINTGDLERVAEFIDPAYVDRNDLTGGGIDGAKKHIEAVRSTWSDLRVTIDEQIEEGDLVVTRCTGNGTHTGTWLGIKPTNKRMTIQAVNIDRIRNGKIVEHWGVADAFQSLFAIGALTVKKES
jgi:predicted ester cyclase